MKILAVLTLATLLVACAERSSDEQLVRELIASAEKAAEARDTSDVLALVADDYEDALGRDRTRLRGALAAFFAMHPKLELLVDIESIEFPAEGLAQARVNVRGLDTSRFDFGEAVAFDVELRRAGGEWRVRRADRAQR